MHMSFYLPSYRIYIVTIVFTSLESFSVLEGYDLHQSTICKASNTRKLKQVYIFGEETKSLKPFMRREQSNNKRYL